MTITVRSNELPQAKPQAPQAPEAKQEVSKEPTLSAPGGHEPSEQKLEAEHSEGLATEESSESESLDRESHEDTESKEQEKSEEKKPKKGGFQKRVDKLNARIAEKEREAEFWRQQALKSQGSGDAKSEPSAKNASPKAPEGKPLPEQYETHAEYVEALTEWKTDQKLKDRDEKAERDKAQTEQQKTVQAYLERKEAFSKKTPDFDDVIAEVDDIRVSPAVRDIILSSENGPELAYELAKDRDEYARICKLPPIQAAREMGKLESRILAKPSAPEAKKITNAPKPLEPVGTGKGSAPKKSIFDPDLSQADYERLRREQMKRRQS